MDMKEKMDVYDWFLNQNKKRKAEKGGPGSGNWGHSGLPGVHGGSAPKKGGSGSGGAGSGSHPTKGQGWGGTDILPEGEGWGMSGGGDAAGGGGGESEVPDWDKKIPYKDWGAKKWASFGNDKMNKLGKDFSKFHSTSFLTGALRGVKSEIDKQWKLEDKTKEPSTYMQSLLNKHEVINMALSYRKGGGYTIGE